MNKVAEAKKPLPNRTPANEKGLAGEAVHSQTDRRTDRQTDKQTERQTNKTDIRTYAHTFVRQPACLHISAGRTPPLCRWVDWGSLHQTPCPLPSLV